MTIRILRGEYTDTARGNRVVPWKITLPAEQDNQKPLPVVLWSHGLGGSREGAGFLARHLAAHGLAALHITHLGTDTSLWEGKSGHPWDIMRRAPIPHEAIVERFADITFMISVLEDFKDAHLDPQRVGMSGHSLGALTTQVMMGQLFDGRSFGQEDLRGGIVYSPLPACAGASTYHTIKGPILFMTAHKDDSPFGDFGAQDRIAVYEGTGASDKALIVLEGGDHMVFAGSRGQLPPNPHQKECEAQICAHSLAFWQRVLV